MTLNEEIADTEKVQFLLWIIPFREMKWPARD
jgi:hypothetical protein